MHPLNRRFLVHLLAVTMAGALPWVLVAPSGARAGCGNYVVTGDKGSAAAYSNPLPHLPASPYQMPSIPSAPHDGSKPCSGPMCSRAPLSLPTAPPSVAPQQGNDAAQPTLLLNVAEIQHIDCCLDETPQRPIRRGAEVYHPPRCWNPQVSA